MFKNLFKERKAETNGPGGLSRYEIIYLICVVAIALALRFVYHFEMRDTLLARSLQLDEQFHDRWARSIAAGDVVGKGVFFRAPLYPYILGLLYAVFGASAETPRIIQHLLGGAAIILIYFLGRSLFGKKAAVLASLLGAFYAVMIHFEGRLLFDFAVAFLILLWLTLAVYYAERPSWRRYALLGMLFGLICTMRPPFLGISPLLFGYILWNHGKDKARIARCAVPLVGAFLIPVLIVTARNALVGGDFVLVASQGGINFYIGNNPLSDGCTPSVPEAGGVAWENRNVQYIAEQAVGHPLSPSEVSAYWYTKGWEFIHGMPLAALELLLRKFYLFWSHIEIANNLSYYSFERSSAVLTALPVGFWLLGSLGLAGALRAWSERRARLPLLFMWSYCAVTIAFFVCDRFRLPIVPLLCVFSGYTLQLVIQSITARRRGSSVRLGALITGSALLVNTNILQLRPEMRLGEEELQAAAAMESGDLAKAAELFGRVATLDHENLGARVNQGNAFWRMGKTREAIEAFHAGIGSDPYFALLSLAHLYFTMRLPDSALFYADRSITARPFAPGGYIIAAQSMMALHDMRQAEQVLLKGAMACGSEFVYGNHILAGVYLQNGNLVAADSIYRQVLVQATELQHTEYVIQSEMSRFGEEIATVHAKTLHALGRMFAAQQKLDSSEVYFRAAARQLPMRSDVWADLGICLLGMNRLEEADTVFRRAISIDTYNPLLWFNYAVVLARKGELQDARRAVSQALALKPDFEEAALLMETLNKKVPQHSIKK